jgi:hypothetical protein
MNEHDRKKRMLWQGHRDTRDDTESDMKHCWCPKYDWCEHEKKNIKHKHSIPTRQQKAKILKQHEWTTLSSGKGNNNEFDIKRWIL